MRRDSSVQYGGIAPLSEAPESAPVPERPLFLL